MYYDESEREPSANGTQETTSEQEQVQKTQTSVAQPETLEEQQDLMAAAMHDDAGGFKRLKKGETVEGTVVHVDKDRVHVDVGTKSEGIIDLEELSNENITTTDGIVTIGEKINVVVLDPQNQDGNPVLSKRRADFEDAWEKIEETLNSQQIMYAMVTERVKGGLVVDVGVRGFVPATHVGNGKLRNIERFVGQSIPLKVLEIDRERRKVVLSHKLAEEEKRETLRTEVFGKLQQGQIMEGIVRRIVDYGAFVDLGGVDGLLHVSEVSWTRISHPSDELREGDKIKVKILKVDPDTGKISLGRRQVMQDPWSLVNEKYAVGETVKLPVSRIVQSGAFIKLPEGVEAFLPIGEMSHKRISRPGDVVSEGQIVEAQIIEIRPDERRMALSIKALQQHVERQEVEKHASKQQRSGGMTIGERLGAMRGLLANDADVSEQPASEEKVPEPITEPEAVAEPETTVEPSAEVSVQEPVVDEAQETPGTTEEEKSE